MAPECVIVYKVHLNNNHVRVLSVKKYKRKNNGKCLDENEHASQA